MMVVRLVSVREESGDRFARSVAASRLTPPPHALAPVLAGVIYAALEPDTRPDAADTGQSHSALTPLALSGVVGSADARGEKDMMMTREVSGAKRKEQEYIMLAAVGFKPVAPEAGRSEEERDPQENSFLIHVSNPCSLSLVPVKSVGDNQSLFGGGPSSSSSWYMSSGSGVTDEKSRGLAGPFFSSSRQS